MKKLLYFIAAFVAIFACSKESQAPQGDQETNNNAHEQVVDDSNTVHELLVTIPEIEDADAPGTKASISESDGSFSWNLNDKIVVITNTNDKYQFTASASGKSVRFTYTGPMNGTPKTVIYPYNADGEETALPTAISGLSGALDSEYLRMTGSVTSNSVVLAHTNALLKVTFADAPALISKKVRFVSTTAGYEQNVLVSGVSLTERGEVVAYIPVKAGTYGFTVTLEDDNNNPIFTQSTTSNKTFVAGSLKTMKSLTVGGWSFVFSGASGIDQARYYKRYNDVIYKDTEGDRLYASLNTMADGTTKWYVLQTSGKDWIGGSYPVALDVYNKGNYVSETQCLYLCRDFEFDCSENSLKTEYRIYPHSSTRSSINMYVTRPIYIYVQNTAGWGTYEVHCYGHKSDGLDTWSGNKSWSGSYSIGDHTGLARFDIDSRLCGSDSTSGIAIGYFGNDDHWFIYNNFVGDCFVNFTGSTSTITEYFNNRISAAWPGTSFTGVTSGFNPQKYYSFGNSYYGNTVWVVFSVNGNSQSGTWVITINRDYDYGY